MNNNELEKWILKGGIEYSIEILGRMQQDCEYFVGNGNGYEGDLWALKVEDQIHFMKFIYNSLNFEEKPKWLKLEQIENYEKEMLMMERKIDKFYFNRGVEECFNAFVNQGLEKIKVKKEELEEELTKSYDPYNRDDQFKDGYIKEAQRIIEIEKMNKSTPMSL